MSAPASENARARFVGLTPPFDNRVFPISGTAVIGRGAECDVALDAVSVSRQHARVEASGDGRFHVRDLGSRNGIRIADQLVHEADLKNGDILTVGEIQLRFEAVSAAENGAESGPARPLTGKDILSLVQAQAGAAAPGGAAMPEGPPPPPRLGLNLKMLVVIVLAFVFSIVAGALILGRLNAPPSVNRGSLDPVLVKIGQKQWLYIGTVIPVHINDAPETKMGDLRGLDVPNVIPLTDPEVADVQRYDKGEIVVTGKSIGVTAATITLSNGSILTLKVLVRGRLTDPLDDLRFGNYTVAQRQTMAEQYLSDAKAEQKARPAVALEDYQKADALLSQVAAKGATYLAVRTGLDDAQAAITAHWNELQKEIMSALQNHDLTTAMTLLKQAVALVPDPNDPRHQKAQWAIQNLIRQQLFEQEHSR